MNAASPYWARLERFWPVASLRSYLIVTILVALVPVSVFFAYQIAREIRTQQMDTASMLLQNADAKARMVSREIGASVDALYGLARSEALMRGDMAGFERMQRMAPQLRRNWHSIFLLGADGQPVFDTAQADGRAAGIAPATRRQCAQARPDAPVVTDLFADTVSPQPATLVCVAIPVAGAATHVMAARIDSGAWQALAEDARLPRGTAITLFDGDRRVIASTAEPRTPIGAPLPQFGVPGREGRIDRATRVGSGMGLPAVDVYATWRTVPSTAWGVSVETAAAPIDRARRETVVAALSTTGACLLLGIVAALMLARHVTRPLHRMALPALVRSSQRVAIREIADLRDALANAERAQQAAQQRETDARFEVEAAARAKDEFLSTLSHELRTPLGALLSASELLQVEGDDPGVQSEARTVIGRQTLHMARLIGEMLDMSQVVSGQIALYREPVSLSGLVASIHARLRNDEALGGHQVLLDLQEVWIDADESRMRQALSTLLVAVLNGRTPGGRIDIRTGRAADGMAELRIADTGEGAAATVLPQVFERFVRGHRLLDHRAGALGLRLALISRLVELHGGQVDMYRKASAACFVVRLPAIDAPLAKDIPPPGQNPLAPSAEPEASGTLPSGGSSYRVAASRCRQILVVHQDAAVRVRVCNVLAAAGHRVESTGDAADGLRRLLQDDPQVVLMGSDQPGPARVQCSRQARAAGYAGRMVAFDLPDDPAVADAMRVAGFDGCLRARSSVDALYRVVEEP